MTFDACGQVIEYNRFRVVVVHRNEIVKKGLEKILAEDRRVLRVWSCESVSSARSVLAKCPDEAVLVLAAHSLAGDGARLRGDGGQSVKVLLLLDDVDAGDRVHAAAWADGFLVESTLTAETLSESLGQVSRGEVPMPPGMARSLLTRVAREHEQSAAQRLLLTQREQQTLRLVVDGLSNKQIARRLGVGVNSVKRHVSNLLAKLNCPNRTKAAAYAIHVGLVAERRESG
ncbi:DNA-binding NarL/FixJ family response regulator [Crossiella equi]|uniref:DNA-binding NarL/FixJ family response regulator n=1 Tax=Crossiella equi TaxID=130796 RepID=A0ABS5AT09_9PSEU|nr:response regulator transcription factor [Crossiella equi]MBP2479708.1 DNA-binding NarL/FixJ family response regulator [Crossiella equi]